MRYRIVIETDYLGTRDGFKKVLRQVLETGALSSVIPGTIVYLAQDVADTHVLSHDGKTTTIG